MSPRHPIPWLQLLTKEKADPSPDASALLLVVEDHSFPIQTPIRVAEGQLLGLAISSTSVLEEAVSCALAAGLDLLFLDGASTAAGKGSGDNAWPELAGAPNLRLLRDTVAILRRLGREEEVDLVYRGGVRSGTDAAKLVGLGAVAMVMGVSAGLAAGGRIAGDALVFDADRGADDRALAIANLIVANTGEATMMARCCGKTDLHNIEPEDLRALTLATSESTGIPLVGKRAV